VNLLLVDESGKAGRAEDEKVRREDRLAQRRKDAEERRRLEGEKVRREDMFAQSQGVGWKSVVRLDSRLRGYDRKGRFPTFCEPIKAASVWRGREEDG